MKTFEDLKFNPHSVFTGSVHAVLFFDNGYGISVVNGKGAYVLNNSQYEIAVLLGNENKWDLCYDTDITDDVIGYLSKDDVSIIMEKIQNLK